MKALSLYIEKWYIVGAVIDDSGLRPLTFPNAEERIWLYFYNDVEANRLRYSKSYKGEATANAMNYYCDIFSLIPSSKEKSYKWYGSDKPMRTIFGNAGIFEDLRNEFDKNEKIPTFLAFSSDICLESQSIFWELLKENDFDVKEFVAHIENLAVEYAKRKGMMNHCIYILVANACNENLHYALYHQKDGLFVQVGKSMTLTGKGEDSRKFAIVEQVIDNMNAGSRMLSKQEERAKEHQFLSQYAEKWLSMIDENESNTAIPLGNVCFSKQKGNAYSVSVLKSDIDKRTAATVDEIVNEMVKITSGNNVENHEISHMLLIGDVFDNSEFEHNLQRRFAIPAANFVHIHEQELANVVSIYRELPSGLFDSDEKAFEKKSTAEIEQAQKAKKDKDALEKARQKEQAEREARQKKEQLSKNIENLQKLAEEAERKEQYEISLGYFKDTLALSPENTYFKEKIDKLTDIIAENKSKKKQYDEYILMAKKYLAEKNLEEAITQSRLALGVMPDSKEASDISKQANEIKNRYARLEEYITKINTLIEHKNFGGALEELEKAKVLKIVDVRVNELEKKIYDAQKATRIAELKQQIDKSVWEENWQEVVASCQEALTLQSDDEIKSKLAIAKRKLSIISQKEIEISDFEKVEQLIENGNLKGAKEQIKYVAKNYPEKKEEIRKLRKRLFDADELQGVRTRGTADSDDFFEIKRGQSTNSESHIKSRSNPVERKTGDDFFDSNS